MWVRMSQWSPVVRFTIQSARRRRKLLWSLNRRPFRHKHPHNLKSKGRYRRSVHQRSYVALIFTWSFVFCPPSYNVFASVFARHTYGANHFESLQSTLIFLVVSSDQVVQCTTVDTACLKIDTSCSVVHCFHHRYAIQAFTNNDPVDELMINWKQCTSANILFLPFNHLHLLFFSLSQL